MGRPRIYSDDERKERQREARKRYADRKRQEKIQQCPTPPRLSPEEKRLRANERARVYKKQNRDHIRELERARRRKKGIPFRQKYSSDEEVYKARLKRSQLWKQANQDKVLMYSIVSNLALSMGVARHEIPSDLITAKLAIVNVKRKIKELSK
jgi:hypothetical protein